MVGTPAMPSTQTLIHAEHVSRDYRLGEAVIRAVNDLSLEICSGEFLALLGSSGSGKSTLLNLMAGLDRPTSGAIHVRGQNLAALDSQGLARYRRETVKMSSFHCGWRKLIARSAAGALRRRLSACGLASGSSTARASFPAASNSAERWLAR